MESSRNIDRLVEIMAALRDPDTGCPWDVEQSFETIAPYTIEEAYEVIDAIERKDAEGLRDELGDLLLQVVYHAQLASERGLFDFGGVVEGVTSKMIRRHPHVFGDETARTAGSAKGQWERIKAEEKAEKAVRRLELNQRVSPSLPSVADEWQRSSSAAARAYLDAVPSVFPALTLALKVQEKAAAVGFDWDSREPIMEKIQEELGELDASASHGTQDEIEDELGDVLFTVVNLARFHDVDPESALRRCVRKFRNRFGYIETRLIESGDDLNTASLPDMERLWIEAKHVLASHAGKTIRTSG